MIDEAIWFRHVTINFNCFIQTILSLTLYIAFNLLI